MSNNERLRLLYLEDLLRDAWVRTDDVVAKESISTIAGEVQNMISGDWKMPQVIEVQAKPWTTRDNVHYLPGSEPK